MSFSNTQVLLTASDIEHHIGEHLLLDKVSLSIHKGEKIGLVGRNGSGKTTLLKILLGQEKPDRAKIETKRDITIGYLSQKFTLDNDKSVYENLMQGAHDILTLINQYNDLSDDNERKHELFEEIAELDGWDLEHRIDSLINSMHLHSKDTIIKNLSGGEKRRLSIAKAIVGNPDLLILDEPTNHLDTVNIEWLERFLQKYNGAVLFITHDRYFLDRIATRIIELSNTKLFSYSGNYTDFLIKKSERMESEQRAEHNREKFMEKELAWIARSPQGRTTKSKGRIQRYENIASEKQTPAELEVEMIIPTPPKLSDRVLDIKNLGLEINGKVLFSDLNLNFQKGMKVGIVGKNGAGKSSLLKIIIGDNQPTTGIVDIASRTEINYSDQEKLILNPDNTVIEEISDSTDTVFIGGKTLHPRGYLKRFLFNDRQLNSNIKNLSGGEQSRLILAKILKKGGNFLILDEPTNDLDLSTLRILEEALISFDGCVIVVSHDRYFLNRVCTHILGFEGNGKTRLLAGDYNFYSQIRDGKLIEEDKIEQQPKTNIDEPKLSYDQQKEIKRIENLISNAEKEVARQEAVFSEPDFYEKYADKVKELSIELQKAKDKVHDLYKKWAELAG